MSSESRSDGPDDHPNLALIDRYFEAVGSGDPGIGDLFTDDEYLDVETYNYVSRGLEDVGRGRGATAEPDRRLDYLFVDPGLEVLGAGPVVGRRSGAMDHDPLAADLLRDPD